MRPVLPWLAFAPSGVPRAAPSVPYGGPWRGWGEGKCTKRREKRKPSEREKVVGPTGSTALEAKVAVQAQARSAHSHTTLARAQTRDAPRRPDGTARHGPTGSFRRTNLSDRTCRGAAESLV